MGILRIVLRSYFAFILISACALAQDGNSTGMRPQTHDPAANQLNVPVPGPTSFDQVLDKVVEREHFFTAQMHHLHPLVETYIQNLKGDKELGMVPVNDQYFLGRIDLSNGTEDRSFMGQPGFKSRVFAKLTSLYAMRFLPLGFAQMVIVDDNFQRKYYDFTFVRREFLGEVRCLVIDVQPKEHAGTGRFMGRIWVEDQDYNIVRFNGTYSAASRYSYYLHFDSWRLNLRPGLWLPAYIYSEESDLHYRMTRSLRFKAQTRLWGYDLQHLGRNEEFTQILVDTPQVHDQSDAAQDAVPVESQRLWERQAEDNAIERLQKIGLLAPEGDVDKILQTVVNNLVVTNNLEIQPEIRTRVLLTSPLESFTIGHTIVVSRGLLDVLPDEASLAMVMAHELGHIALGHRLDTKLAFNDRMFFPDQETFERMDFSRSASDEDAADKKALELLTNSPYKDKLANAGLFLKALQERAPQLKHLISPHLGNSLANGKSLRMSALLNSAPKLDVRKTDQIAALPLGGRIKLDPWSNHIELVKTKPVAILSPQEKMPFEVTPFFPYLIRLSGAGPDKVALTAPVK
ncbi:MAG TPA: M48 family metalloprotease [Terriglobales bacterium]|nr:M48 family metalloprotease [Terriglobales bacterium]